MPTFIWDPGYPPELTETPRVITFPMGDGYTQRTADGINTISQVWNLTFPNVSDALALAILDFLRTQAGWQAFDWVPPRASATIKVICQEWRQQVASKNANVITATFQQVHEP